MSVVKTGLLVAVVGRWDIRGDGGLLGGWCRWSPVGSTALGYGSGDLSGGDQLKSYGGGGARLFYYVLDAFDGREPVGAVVEMLNGDIHGFSFKRWRSPGRGNRR